MLTKTNVPHTLKVHLKKLQASQQLLGHSLKTSHNVNQNSLQFWLYKHHITAPHSICCLESIPGCHVHYLVCLTQLCSTWISTYWTPCYKWDLWNIILSISSLIIDKPGYTPPRNTGTYNHLIFPLYFFQRQANSQVENCLGWKELGRSFRGQTSIRSGRITSSLSPPAVLLSAMCADSLEMRAAFRFFTKEGAKVLVQEKQSHSQRRTKCY